MRTLVSTLTVMVALAVGSASAAAPSTSLTPGGHASPVAGASVAAPSASVKSKAHKKALRNCQKIRKAARRKACIKRVNRNFSKPAPVVGTTYDIEVRDKYFNPTYIEIKSGDSLLWTWPYVNKDAHNVDLVTGPKGVERLDFATPSSPSVGFTFKRAFTVPGTYNFVCSIHKLMAMQVEVAK